MKNQKEFILGLILMFFLIISLGSCASGNRMTGSRYIKKEQKYYNYESAMERRKKADKKLVKEAKKRKSHTI